MRNLVEAAEKILKGEVDEAKKPLHPNQQKLDVHEPEKDELTANDFEMLRKGKKVTKEEKNVKDLTDDDDMDDMDDMDDEDMDDDKDEKKSKLKESSRSSARADKDYAFYVKSYLQSEGIESLGQISEKELTVAMDIIEMAFQQQVESFDQLDEISVATMLRAKTAAKKRVAKAEEEGDEPTFMKRSAQAAKFDTAAKKKYAQNK